MHKVLHCESAVYQCSSLVAKLSDSEEWEACKNALAESGKNLNLSKNSHPC
jgi:hypothetical protein